MRMDALAWEQLALMLAALEHGSLNRAAKALGIGQATASRRLGKLEDALGARVFDRTPEGLLPTALALELAPHARLIAGHMADIRRVAAGNEAAPQGRVRLAIVDGLVSAWLAPRLSGLFAQHPGIELDLVSGHAVVDLVRREADLALRFVRPSAPDLVMRRLGAIPMAAYARPELGPQPQRWVALLDPGERFSETRWLNAHAAEAQRLRVSNWADLFACARAGLGAALLSPLIAEPEGLVCVGDGLPPVPERALFLVYHRAMRDVPRIAAVRRWLVREVEGFFAPPARGSG